MWAFSDESERAGVMLFAVVLIDPGELAAARAGLGNLLLAGQRRVHTTDESPRRRRVLLDTVARTKARSAVVLRYRRPPGVDRPAGRHLLLQAAAGLVVGSGVTAWTLDDHTPPNSTRIGPASPMPWPASIVICTRSTTTVPPTPSRCCGLLTPCAGRPAPAGTGVDVSGTWSLCATSALDAQHPATPRPGSSPGALPAATATSTTIIPRLGSTFFF